jgi:hypothetical protein
LSPTQRTLAVLKEEGTPYWRVEHFNPYSKTRQDLFGFLDYLALYPDAITGIQITSAAHRADHRAKILKNEYAPQWLRSGGRIQLRTWYKGKKRVNNKYWVETVEEITIDQFDAV